jgi:hypothetical protein
MPISDQEKREIEALAEAHAKGLVGNSHIGGGEDVPMEGEKGKGFSPLDTPVNVDAVERHREEQRESGRPHEENVAKFIADIIEAYTGEKRDPKEFLRESRNQGPGGNNGPGIG